MASVGFCDDLLRAVAPNAPPETLCFAPSQARSRHGPSTFAVASSFAMGVESPQVESHITTLVAIEIVARGSLLHHDREVMRSLA